ncbi:MAG: HEAT repeat domain-containing protein [Acidimicrobiia bacterium]|nr:HEAT repeat domain-containing protein [Acidimicrobiia bacterium]
MSSSLLWWLSIAAVSALVAIVVLVILKVTHRLYRRWQGVRSAQYVAVVGEMVSRNMLPLHPSPDWSHDPMFHNALVEYRLSLVGSEQGFVDELVAYLGVPEVLLARIARRFPPSARLAAVSTFVDLATDTYVEDLRRLLVDPNNHVAIHAAKGLSRLRDVTSVPAILNRAVEASPWHAARLADALVHFGPEVGPPIREWIEQRSDTDEPPVSTIALGIRVLGQVSDADAEALLLRLLTSDQPDWRLAAASALGSAGGDDAVLGLIDALDDDHWPVRARAASSLGRLAAAPAADRLRLLLNDPMWWVRQNAAEAIGWLPGGTGVLISVLSGEDPYAADAALYQLTMQGEVAEAARRSRAGTQSAIDIDLLAYVGNLASESRYPDLSMPTLESVTP